MVFFTRFATYILFAILLGFGLTALSLSTGSGLAAKRIGGWKSWKNAGHVNADPYTRAYIAKTGQLPLPPQIAQTFYALYDNAHRRLHTSCTYRIESGPVPAKWWTIAAYDHQGQIFPNEFKRYSYNAASAMIKFNGGFHITLSKTIQPDNWLPLGANGPFVLVFRVYRNQLTAKQIKEEGEQIMPLIKRVSC